MTATQKLVQHVFALDFMHQAQLPFVVARLSFFASRSWTRSSRKGRRHIVKAAKQSLIRVLWCAISPKIVNNRAKMFFRTLILKRRVHVSLVFQLFLFEIVHIRRCLSKNDRLYRPNFWTCKWHLKWYLYNIKLYFFNYKIFSA